MKLESNNFHPSRWQQFMLPHFECGYLCAQMTMSFPLRDSFQTRLVQTGRDDEFYEAQELWTRKAGDDCLVDLTVSKCFYTLF